MAKRLHIEIGRRFHRLTILKEVDKRNGRRYFSCLCDCGNIKEHRLTSMTFGAIKSCGCLRNEQNRSVAITHGKWGKRIYWTWHSMKSRVLDKNQKHYKHYGGRGIKICNEWLKFELFYEWAINNGYKDDLTIERVDNDGDYEPSNCTFIPLKDQNKNKRNNVFFEFKGERLCISDWAERLNLSHTAMSGRFKNWDLEKALTTPKKRKHDTSHTRIK